MLFKGESLTLLQTTTIEVLVLKDAAPVPSHRVLIQTNVPSDSADEEIQNTDTRSDERVISHASF